MRFAIKVSCVLLAFAGLFLAVFAILFGGSLLSGPSLPSSSSFASLL